ncbi:cell division protein FtsN [Mannheimia haemolytica]|uniref:cell division protein FtsN n=1 Tax=Mannheimia haemolytica TaxID=75985 RepID=UPI0031F5D806
MPQREYVARSNEKKSKKNQKESNVKKILMRIIGVILFFGIGLWFLKSSAPVPTVPSAPQPANSQTKSELPSRPEETWSYIRDLETRTVITDNSQTSQERLAQLTAEQKQQIEERRKQEEARLAAEQAQQKPATDVSATELAPKTEEVKSLTEEELAAKKAQEQALAQKQAEEKRRQAELKKQQEAKKEQPAKIVASAATLADKAANQAGKFGLQCGAFKNKAQAENMQARLAMAGFNARIASSADWNRVFVGPIGDRAATSRAQSNARSVAECVIVAM